MPYERRGPSDSELEAYLERGLTHQEIVAEHLKVKGERVSVAAVSQTIRRAGLSKIQQSYLDTIPETWRPLRREAHKEYAARMLRALSRRRSGLPPVEADEAGRLDRWLKGLNDEGHVVACAPNAPDRTFWYVPGAWPEDGIPIVRELIL